jgi:hypothetical protein
MDMSENIYEDYGWANGWRQTPQAIVKCNQKGHPSLRDGSYTNVDIGPPLRGLHHVVRCNICKIIYHYDSSD